MIPDPNAGRLRAANTLLGVAVIDLGLALFFFFAGGAVLGIERQFAQIIAAALLFGAVATAIVGLVMRKKALAGIVAAEQAAAGAAGDRPVVWRRGR